LVAYKKKGVTVTVSIGRLNHIRTGRSNFSSAIM